MVTIKYNEYNQIINNWKLALETSVIEHQLIEDKTIEQPILMTNSETIIGEYEISKCIEELVIFQKVWYCS
jgi:hypothetical protein